MTWTQESQYLSRDTTVKKYGTQSTHYIIRIIRFMELEKELKTPKKKMENLSWREKMKIKKTGGTRKVDYISN
jgi:hypothetical protein